MSRHGRHLGFYRTGNRAVRSTDPENTLPSTKHEVDRVTRCGDMVTRILGHIMRGAFGTPFRGKGK